MASTGLAVLGLNRLSVKASRNTGITPRGSLVSELSLGCEEENDTFQPRISIS